MMSLRIEILNEGGFRSDGRRQYELREITFDSTTQASSDGSARVTHGLTEVLVSVFGPREARVRSQTLHDRATIHVEASIAPLSTGDRRRRGRGDKRILELAAMIKATFEPVVQTSLYPRSQIDIFVQVLQQDGGVLQAAINATTIALINAGVPLTDYVCAVTGGAHAAAPMLDLTALEESDLPHMTVASMPRSGRLTLVSMETRLHIDRFEEILRLAGEAGAVIHKEMRAVVKERTKGLLEGMSIGLRVSKAAEEDAMVENE
ncbi:ribosomal protein S5 domain 2-type protein [Multifurca ochricompacta]|uniref:Ribosomal RNA-processing protein 41 n=1 Tax=Multifurca ochricompacta TaxID=376703 RepID=A0AAD4M029_9AGAM|nr:ribosomal protein S5 domain 2-type protein [Multifurca ochricompacta]